MTDFSAPPSAPTVTFWGAAQNVTGSMHLVRAAGKNILLDCGLVRGRRDHRAAPPVFPFDPGDLHAVVLSHAHVDHCGNLPSLVCQGFAGPIYCTPATRDLLALVLADSARFQEEDAFIQRVIDPTDPAGHAPSVRHHANEAVHLCVPVPYDQPLDIADGIRLRLVNAGHILGSAMVHLTFQEAGRERSLTFTGDLGRRGSPLLRPAAPVPAADLVISESTYGGRLLPSPAEAADRLEVLARATLDRGGKVLVPAFSLGRTQVLAHYFREWVAAGRIPDVPVFVDSPMAADIAGVYQHYPECLHADYARDVGGPESPAAHDGILHYVRRHDESRELGERRGPCVIVAPGGMCDGGRIVHHLKANIDDPRCLIVLVSYQAPHTLGRSLMEPKARIRIHGHSWNFWAEVAPLPGFSGHPDQGELLSYLSPLAGDAPRVRLVHGEPEQADVLARLLRERGFRDVAVPVTGGQVEII